MYAASVHTTYIPAQAAEENSSSIVVVHSTVSASWLAELLLPELK